MTSTLENRRALAAAHEGRHVETSGRPAHLKIELTNYCNLACPVCPHSTMVREHGYMDPQLFRRIIDMAAPELEFAYLHHLGESLFHPHLGELISVGRRHGAAMGLSTNATFLDAKRGAAILEAGLDFLVISLDAATQDTYARLRIPRRGTADFMHTAAQVRAFLDERRRLKAGTEVSVQLIVTPDNAAEIPRFADEWEALGAAVMIKQPRDWATQVTLPTRSAPSLRPGPCQLPWTELTILWDGLVVPCANVFERVNLLGDLNTQTLDEVWNGAAAHALRRAQLDNQLDEVPVCRSCSGHAFDHADFIAVDQLAQRHRTYLAGGRTLRSGLS